MTDDLAMAEAALDRLQQEHRCGTLGHLTLAAASLSLAIEHLRWVPADAEAFNAVMDDYCARHVLGLQALEHLSATTTALNTIRSLRAQQAAEVVPELPAVGNLAAATDLATVASSAPADRRTKLDALAETMAATAEGAQADLGALARLLRDGTPNGDAADLVATMQSFMARSEELKSIFVEAGEVAECGGSA